MRQVVNRITEVDFNDLKKRQHSGEIYEQLLNDLQSAGNAGEYYTPRPHRLSRSHRSEAGESLLDPPAAPAASSPVPSITCASAT